MADTLARVLALTNEGGGEPATYIKNAAVSGNKLTLTKKDDTTIEFTDTNTEYTAGEGISITNGVISLSLAAAETQNF